MIPAHTAATAWSGLRTRLRRADPGLLAIRKAARGAIVMPAVFAFADKVVGDPDTATFAAFGSFAILLLADFSGPRLSRVAAYCTLTAAGAVFIVLGTLCSCSPWAAAAGMAVVGFGISFSGVVNGYFAAASTAAMLTFVLPVTIPAPMDVVPARLAGWGLAAGVGVPASLLLWPTRPRDELRRLAARACFALADLLRAELPVGDGSACDPQERSARSQAAADAVTALRTTFEATPYRPTGATGREQALARLIDEIDWLHSFLALPSDTSPRRTWELGAQANRVLLSAVADALCASAHRLAGRPEVPDIARLQRARLASVYAVADRVVALPPIGVDEAMLVSGLDPSFRLRTMSYAARSIAIGALVASGMPPAEVDQHGSPVATPESLVRAAEGVAARHVSATSVWFRNSLRAAAGLALAVLVAQLASLQHAFWAVLGTMSVLRSNALGTGSTALRAVLGTLIGIVVGGALVLAIGTNDAVLWSLFPLAVLLAGYAPAAISFTAGQAAFTLVIVFLFNLLQPVGWRVGLVRIEDVVIGCVISVGVGLLFWPRGAGRALFASLAAAYERNADYVAETVGGLADERDQSNRSAHAAEAAAVRLDDAFREYLSERGAKRVRLDSVASLVQGTARVRFAADSLGALTLHGDSSRAAHALDPEALSLRSWFLALAGALVRGGAVPPPHARDLEARRQVVRSLREAVVQGDRNGIRAGLRLLWAGQHLDDLWRLESRLREPAGEVVRHGQGPWWR